MPPAPRPRASFPIQIVSHHPPAARLLADERDAARLGGRRGRSDVLHRPAACPRQVGGRHRRDARPASSAAAFSLRGRRTRGRHSPLSGHCVSPCFLPKPQAFIMPTWHSEKSKRTGSRGSSARSEAVMSAAIRQPGLVYRVRRRQRPRRMTCVSSGTISLRRRHARPDAEVHFVGPRHPAKEQVQPLAGAAGRWPRKEVTDARPARQAAVRAPHVERERARRKAVERGTDVLVIVADTLRGRTLRSILTAPASGAGSRAAPRDRRRGSSGAPSRASRRMRRSGSKRRTKSAGCGP